MNDPPHSADRAALMSEAHEWVMRLTSGEATTADAEALNRWRRTSRAHRRAFAEANLLWSRLHPAAVASACREEQHVRGARSLGRRAFLGGAGAAAATLAAYAAVHPPLHLWPSVTELAADFRTGTGQQRRIALEGGASMQLSPQTSIAVLPAQSPGNAVERIELLAGEAAITTGPPRLTPFIVLAERGRTAATNARFDIRNDNGAVCVTCLAGSVKVEHLGRTATVTANEQVRYTIEGLEVVAGVDAEAATAWQRGLLVFRDEPLARVIDEVNRYRPGKIILVNKELARQSVLATFQLDRIDEVVPRLQAVFELRVRTLPGGIVLLS